MESLTLNAAPVGIPETPPFRTRAGFSFVTVSQEPQAPPSFLNTRTREPEFHRGITGTSSAYIGCLPGVLVVALSLPKPRLGILPSLLRQGFDSDFATSNSFTDLF
jgi:hypothetical protein